MDALSLISSRHCVRSYDSNRSVPKALISEILDAAKFAPSSQNTQPWNCTIITGSSLKSLSERLLKDFGDNIPRTPDYLNRPATLPKSMKEEMDKYGESLYEDHFGLPRDDIKARQAIYCNNYSFWGAPMLIVLTIPSGSVAGTFIDSGLFLQNVLLGCHGCGLGALPQFSIAAYSPAVKEVAGIPKDEVIVCGISIGYPKDDESGLASWRPERKSLGSFTRWLD